MLMEYCPNCGVSCSDVICRVVLISTALFPLTADASHRLNLFYLANDVIQNCKRKNAIVYRTAFAEVLRDTFALVK